MKPGEAERWSLVHELLDLSRPLDELIARLSVLDWDYEGAGVVLTKQHLARVLRRFLEMTLAAADVETWSNLVEAREDVVLDSDSAQEIEEVLYELANPTLTQPLDEGRATVLLDMLS